MPLNPFANVGNIVSGSGFIGRTQSLERIKSRVLAPKNTGGSMAIVGMPRTGKSSLVYQAIMEPKEALHAEKMLPIFMYLPSCESSDMFFDSLIEECEAELRKLQWDNEGIRLCARKALQKKITWIKKITNIKYFFEQVSRAGIRVIVFLDEFDHAPTIFTTIQRIQGIRELAMYPDYQVRWIVTIRRRLSTIEAKSPISTLAGVFTDHCLGLFNAEDMALYYQRLADAGLVITTEHRDTIDCYCGQHPYLLALLGYYLIEMHTQNSNTLDVHAAFNEVERKFTDYYKNIIDILQEHESTKFKKLLQVIFGPSYGLERDDLQELLDYGLIKTNPVWQADKPGQAAYVAFSTHFQDYLRSEVSWPDLWPLLGETEKALRSIIRIKLAIKYGNGQYNVQCLLVMIENFPKVNSIFENSRKVMEKDKKNLAATEDLLDYTYPRDLFTIILADWQLFEPVFGKTRKKGTDYWNRMGQLLVSIRNPLAHHRDNLPLKLYPEVKDACEEILALHKSLNAAEM